MGASFDGCTSTETVDWVCSRLREGHGGWVITANLDQVRSFADGDEAVRTYFQDASLVVADGMPLIWASRIQGDPLPERVAGSDLIHSLTSALARDGRRLYLVGGNPGVADRAAATLVRQYEGLTIAGTHCPPFGFDQHAEGLEAVQDALRLGQPDVVYVALGFPKQERLIAQLRSSWPDVWFVGVGISFSFVAGEVRRAPAWVQRAGMEWLHRLAQEPRRLFRRYVVDGLPFAMRIFAHSLVGRVRRPAPQE
jgi:N-acetylglucosaminyldiphosphoundecaprenol N-acetyl-beta-D-mannosaminyltransferase